MGFGQQMTNAEYHAHKAISKSKLDAARKSGRHLRDMLYGPPRESTSHFDMGTVLHASALPGENPGDIAVRMPSGMKKTTKEGKAFVAEHKGKIILNSSDAYVVDQMMLSLREHPFSAGLVRRQLMRHLKAFSAALPTIGTSYRHRIIWT